MTGSSQQRFPYGRITDSAARGQSISLGGYCFSRKAVAARRRPDGAELGRSTHGRG
jgi:hypothetical protein